MSAVHELAPDAGGLAHQRIATAVMIAFFALAPLVAYPVFLMKVMCFALFACAFNLLIGYGVCCPSGTDVPRNGGLCLGARRQGVGLPPEFAILFGTACSALLGLVTGLLAIRRQGIYFAMITLALAQMMYFFYLQAPFTGGEDGIQAVPRGSSSVCSTSTAYGRCIRWCWRCSSAGFSLSIAQCTRRSGRC